MNIKQVSYFVSAAQLGSMSAAAREKGISTQAMSKALSDLRKELPAPLFERIPQGIKLTAFGKQFLEKAKPVCESFSQLENMSDSNPNDPQLALLLVAPAFSDNESAREKLALFFERYLHTKARVDLGTGEEGIAALVALMRGFVALRGYFLQGNATPSSRSGRSTMASTTALSRAPCP